MLARRLAALDVPALCSMGIRGLATKAAGDKAVVTAAEVEKGILVPEGAEFPIPTTIPGGQAFPNDMRSTSGLSIGDGIATHTGKWLQVRLAGSSAGPAVRAARKTCTCVWGSLAGASALALSARKREAPAGSRGWQSWHNFIGCWGAGQAQDPHGVHPRQRAYQGSRPGGGILWK
jgi:hypothetical protein